MGALAPKCLKHAKDAGRGHCKGAPLLTVIIHPIKEKIPKQCSKM